MGKKLEFKVSKETAAQIASNLLNLVGWTPLIKVMDSTTKTITPILLTRVLWGEMYVFQSPDHLHEFLTENRDELVDRLESEKISIHHVKLNAISLVPALVRGETLADAESTNRLSASLQPLVLAAKIKLRRGKTKYGFERPYLSDQDRQISLEFWRTLKPIIEA